MEGIPTFFIKILGSSINGVPLYKSLKCFLGIFIPKDSKVLNVKLTVAHSGPNYYEKYSSDQMIDYIMNKENYHNCIIIFEDEDGHKKLSKKHKQDKLNDYLNNLRQRYI